MTWASRANSTSPKMMGRSSGDTLHHMHHIYSATCCISNMHVQVTHSITTTMYYMYMFSNYRMTSLLSLPPLSAKEAVQYPVFTFSSGPTNSMRGAAFLSGLQDAIVIDIGGTTTDIGVLKNGFPREASSQHKVLCGSTSCTLWGVCLSNVVYTEVPLELVHLL